MSKKSSRRHHLRNAFILFVVLFGGLTLGYFEWPLLSQTWDLATSQHPEAYTSLYFLRAATLPTYSPTNRPQHIFFHVTNHQGAITTYHYIAEITYGNQTYPIAQGLLTLASEQGVDRTLNYVVPRPSTAAIISIRIIGRPEYIQFKTTS